MSVLLAHNVRRAASKHRCDLCGEPIWPADRYLDQRIADEGTVYTFRCHTSCDVRYGKAHRGFELWSDEELEWPEVLAWEASVQRETTP